MDKLSTAALERANPAQTLVHSKRAPEPSAIQLDAGKAAALLKTGALQKAIFKSANFSSIATDTMGLIQISKVGAERMLGCAAVEVVNKLTPADISVPLEVIAGAKALSAELGTPIAPHENPETADIPVLVVTAKHITADDRAKLTRYVATIMEKAGFDSELFTTEVRRAMSGRRQVA
jgi:hypothetical protein